MQRAFALGVVAGAGTAALVGQPVRLAPGATSARPGTDSQHRRRPRSTSTEPPLLRFGVLADIQYCDIDDRLNFSKTRSRAYRGALECLKNAVLQWNASDDVAFVAHLGVTHRALLSALCGDSSLPHRWAFR